MKKILRVYAVKSRHRAPTCAGSPSWRGAGLFTKVIEGFCDDNRDGVTGLDFGPGNAQYKEVLSNQRWRETAVYIFAPSLKGISLNVIRTIIEGMDETIKKALARTNLLQRIKKHWRAHATPKAATQG
jgi:CelD/BcsL family acetyltransferase involved in cellulose biosynthesis